jgi:hypothetical protein
LKVDWQFPGLIQQALAPTLLPDVENARCTGMTRPTLLPPDFRRINQYVELESADKNAGSNVSPSPILMGPPIVTCERSDASGLIQFGRFPNRPKQFKLFGLRMAKKKQKR